jgi:hypothetical protein
MDKNSYENISIYLVLKFNEEITRKNNILLALILIFKVTTIPISLRQNNTNTNTLRSIILSLIGLYSEQKYLTVHKLSSSMVHDF